MTERRRLNDLLKNDLAVVPAGSSVIVAEALTQYAVDAIQLRPHINPNGQRQVGFAQNNLVSASRG